MALAARRTPHARQSAQPHAAARPLRRTAAAPRACAAEPDAAAVPAARLSVTLRTAEARTTLRFAEARLPRACHIIVSAVGVDSEAQAAGVAPGDRLLSVSDPVRPAVLWDLTDSSSLRFVRDALRLRVAPEVTLVLAPGAGVAALAAMEAAEAAEAEAEAARQAVPASRPGLTVGEALEEAWTRKQDTGSLPTPSERRIRRREAYMEEVGKRDDSGFFTAAFAAVLATPLVILAVAAANGWLMPSVYKLH